MVVRGLRCVVLLRPFSRAKAPSSPDWHSFPPQTQSVAISKAREEAQRTLAASGTATPSTASQAHPEQAPSKVDQQQQQQESSEAIAMSRATL